MFNDEIQIAVIILAQNWQKAVGGKALPMYGHRFIGRNANADPNLITLP